MVFDSVVFIVFIAGFLALYFGSPERWQNPLLLAGSYLFYGWWDWRFLSLIALSTVIDFLCGLVIAGAAEGSRARKRGLAISLIANLSMLGFFKYFDFFVDSMAALLSQVGLQANPSSLGVILPVGISFYTFQTMSYTIDVYRGKLVPTKSLLNFAVFVAFFPQLVAGPIERAAHLLPQIVQKRVVTFNHVKEGVWLICLGYFLKIVVADNLALLVNDTFQNVQVASSGAVIVACYAFAFQIFGDFAGYSYIAIGLASLFGISIMTNFKHPYFIEKLADFWNHWHISLSSWLKDYLYISLGGNRGGRFKTYRNLMTTMVLGGLWHGAAWNFVIWGFYQGALLAIERFVQDARGKATNPALWWRLLWMFIIFNLVCYGWLLFRAESVAQIFSFSKALLTPWDWAGDDARNLFFVMLVASPAILLQFVQTQTTEARLLIHKLSRTQIVMLLLAGGYVLAFFGNFARIPFIYFQF